MNRRDLLILSTGAGAWALAARAQQKYARVVGFLSGASPDSYAPFIAAFRSGLRETGYVEGTNLTIEYRWAEDHPDWLPALAADLVGRKVEAILAGGGAPGVAKAATATMPIVFVTGADPVAAGMVTSLNRPGGNLTGVSFLTGELLPKRLEILHDLLPGVTTVAVLVNPKYSG